MEEADLSKNQKFLAARERFDAYHRVLKLTLDPSQLAILAGLLKAREEMAAEENEYWYLKGTYQRSSMTKAGPV